MYRWAVKSAVCQHQRWLSVVSDSILKPCATCGNVMPLWIKVRIKAFAQSQHKLYDSHHYPNLILIRFWRQPDSNRLLSIPSCATSPLIKAVMRRSVMDSTNNGYCDTKYPPAKRFETVRTDIGLQRRCYLCLNSG